MIWSTSCRGRPCWRWSRGGYTHSQAAEPCSPRCAHARPVQVVETAPRPVVPAVGRGAQRAISWRGPRQRRHRAVGRRAQPTSRLAAAGSRRTRLRARLQPGRHRARCVGRRRRHQDLGPHLAARAVRELPGRPRRLLPDLQPGRRAPGGGGRRTGLPVVDLVLATGRAGDPGRNTVSFSPDGRTMTLGNGQDVLLWDLPADRLIESARSPSKDVRKCLVRPLRPHHRRLLDRRAIVLWDVQPLRPRGAPSTATASPIRARPTPARPISRGRTSSRGPRRPRDRVQPRRSTSSPPAASMTASSSGTRYRTAARHLLTTRFERVYGIAFSPDDARVATATSRATS